MSDTQKHTKPNVPNLRFPGFEGEWESRRIGEDCAVNMCKRIFANQTSEQGDVPFFKIGTIGGTPDAYISRDLFEEYKAKYNYPRKGEVMITCAGTVGKTIVFDGEDAYFQDSNIVWLSNQKQLYINPFLNYVLSRVNWNKLNSTTITRIYNDNLRELVINYPSIKEQEKIVALLSLLDQRILTQNKVIEKYESLIKALRHHLFSTLEPVKEVSFADVLSYEQPTKYIVSDTEYSDDKDLTPVLTANKAFILGYTEETKGVYDKGPCIILDDFTLDTKIVDFPFKVKSSAIKILSAKTSVRLRYIYEYLKFLDLNTEEHKRHYIAEIEPMTIELPEEGAIQSIAYLFDLMDQRRKGLERDLNLLKAQKDYLLRAIFI